MPQLVVPVRRRGALVKALVRSGPGSPPSAPFIAYLDTGASHTMIEPAALRPLRLAPARDVSLSVLGRAGVSHHESFEVEVALAAPGEEPLWAPLVVMAGPVYATG